MNKIEIKTWQDDFRFALKNIEDGNLHEKEYISKVQVAEIRETDPTKGVEETLSLMRKGAPLIYQGWLEKRIDNVIYRGRPDLLEKRPGKSIFGDWIYTPIDIKSSSTVKATHEQQLAFYSMILHSIQGHFPYKTAVVNRNFETIEVILDEKILQRTQRDIDEILSIMRGKKPPTHISGSAKETPWYSECLREAENLRDISLIYKIRKDTAEALRNHGIDTLEKLALQDINALPKIPGATIDTLKKAKIQAQSLVEQKPIFIGAPEPIQETDLKLYFDIEGVKSLGVEYLFGFWVVGDPERNYARDGEVVWSQKDKGKYFLYFLAEAPESESIMWNKFLNWLQCLPIDYKVYHYAKYEKETLTKLSKKYKGSENLSRFQEKLVDLEKNVAKSVVFPLYFYSLKDIAKSPFINFNWRHEKAGGSQSIFWYEQWLEAKDQLILQDIIDYNEDDVRATECLHIWMNKARLFPRAHHGWSLVSYRKCWD